MIINHGPNRTEIHFSSLSIFLSYATPVALYSKVTNTVFISETKYSNTTTRHINRWIDLLIKERGFFTKDESPKSYKTLAQPVLTSIWDKSMKNGIQKVHEIIVEDPSRIKLESLTKLRIQSIMDQ